MALSGTDRGTGTNNTSGLTFTLSPASNFAAGTWAVLAISADNAHSGGTAATTYTVTDTLGNTWTRRATPLNDPGAANAGVEGAFFTTPQNGGTLQTGTVITVTYDTATVAKVWTLMQVTPGSGNDVAFITSNIGTGGTGTTSPTITTGSITANHMVIAGVFIEAGTTETFTDDSDTTNGSWSASQNNKIGSTTSGQAIITQRKVVTATGTQTYNPTLGLAGDLALGWIELNEVVKLIGASAGTSTATSVPTTTSKVAGASDAVSTAISVLTNTRPLAGASAGASTATSALPVLHTLIGASTGASTAASGLMKLVPVVGATAATSTATAQATRTAGLVASSTALSTATSQAVATRKLVGASAAVSSAISAVSATRLLTTSSAAVSTAVGHPIYTAALTTLTNGTSTATSTARIIRGLVTVSTGTSTALASATRSRGFVGASTATSTAAASMDAALLFGAASATATATAHLVAVSSLAAQTTSASASTSHLAYTARLAATAGGASTAAAQAAVSRGLLGLSTAASGSHASASVSVSLVGATAAATSNAAFLSRSLGLAGLASATSSAVGEIGSGVVGLHGTSAAVSSAQLHFPHEPVILTIEQVLVTVVTESLAVQMATTRETVTAWTWPRDAAEMVMAREVGTEVSLVTS